MIKKIPDKEINDYIEIFHSIAKQEGHWDSLPTEEFEKNNYLADKIDLLVTAATEAYSALSSEKYAYNFKNYKSRKHPISFRAIEGTFEDCVTDVFISACNLMGYFKIIKGQYHLHEKFNNIEKMIDDRAKQMLNHIRYCFLETSLGLRNNFLNLDTGMYFELLMVMCLHIAKIEKFDLNWHINAKKKYMTTGDFSLQGISLFKKPKGE